MSNMHDRKFGYMFAPPPPPHMPPPQQCPEHEVIKTHDWMLYINTYIDARARQIYDKLKGIQGEDSQKFEDEFKALKKEIEDQMAIGPGYIEPIVDDDQVKNYIKVKDTKNDRVYKLYFENGRLLTIPDDTDEPISDGEGLPSDLNLFDE